MDKRARVGRRAATPPSGTTGYYLLLTSQRPTTSTQSRRRQPSNCQKHQCLDRAAECHVQESAATSERTFPVDNWQLLLDCSLLDTSNSFHLTCFCKFHVRLLIRHLLVYTSLSPYKAGPIESFTLNNSKLQIYKLPFSIYWEIGERKWNVTVF